MLIESISIVTRSQSDHRPTTTLRVSLSPWAVGTPLDADVAQCYWRPLTREYVKAAFGLPNWLVKIAVLQPGLRFEVTLPNGTVSVLINAVEEIVTVRRQ